MVTLDSWDEGNRERQGFMANRLEAVSEMGRSPYFQPFRDLG